MVDRLSVRESGYLAPRQLLAGPGVSGSAGAALRDWGIVQGQVLVVADRVVSEAGLLSSLVAGLEEVGFEVEVFDEIAGEPDVGVTGPRRGSGARCERSGHRRHRWGERIGRGEDGRVAHVQ